jgi:hypothetical protein
MVKVTGGGRGMKAIAAHFRYISKNGRLDVEDERGETMRGKDTLYDLADDWRFGGTLIDDVAEPGQRREAFNIMLSMPRGTDPLTVQRAAREFAQVELADHKYVTVLHDHQANPHVHISVRAESKARQAPESAQGRPASVARDLCREAARAWHRGRSDPAGDARARAGTTTPLWRLKARAGWPPENPSRQGSKSKALRPRRRGPRSRRSLDACGQGAGYVRGSGGPKTGWRHRGVHQGDADQSGSCSATGCA